MGDGPSRFVVFLLSLRNLPNWERWTWAFVVIVASLDLGFVWRFQETFLEWEDNRLAVIIYQKVGLIGLALWRFGILVFAFCVSLLAERSSSIVTVIWGSVHLYLLVILWTTFFILRKQL